jgi:hypothetical protein
MKTVVVTHSKTIRHCWVLLHMLAVCQGLRLAMPSIAMQNEFMFSFLVVPRWISLDRDLFAMALGRSTESYCDH